MINKNPTVVNQFFRNYQIYCDTCKLNKPIRELIFKNDWFDLCCDFGHVVATLSEKNNKELEDE